MYAQCCRRLPFFWTLGLGPWDVLTPASGSWGVGKYPASWLTLTDHQCSGGSESQVSHCPAVLLSNPTSTQASLPLNEPLRVAVPLKGLHHVLLFFYTVHCWRREAFSPADQGPDIQHHQDPLNREKSSVPGALYNFTRLTSLPLVFSLFPVICNLAWSDLFPLFFTSGMCLGLTWLSVFIYLCLCHYSLMNTAVGCRNVWFVVINLASVSGQISWVYLATQAFTASGA